MAEDQRDLLVRRILRSRELAGLVAAAAVVATVVTTASQCGSSAKKPAQPGNVISGNGDFCNAQGVGRRRLRLGEPLMSAPTRPTAVAALAGLLLLAAGLASCAKTGSHGVNQVGGADNRCNAQGQNITIVCGEGSNGADAGSTAGTARVAGGHSAAPVSSAAAPQPDVVRWTGSLTLGEGGGIVLDTDPPHYDHWEANADVEQGGLATGSLMGSAALWTSAGRPTAKQCSDWVATMNTGTYFALRVGDRVRARSADGRPALLVVQSLSGDAYGPIVFTATVWETPR